MQRIFILTLLSLVFFGKTTSAGEWTRFRGPNGTGQSEATTVPATWTTADYRWRVKLPGIGYSSPVILGDRLFVTCGIEEDATRIVRCLSTKDGRLIWKRSFPSTTHEKHALNAYAASTPTVDHQRLYLTWATPEQNIVLALDQSNGQELWRRDFGPFDSQHGHGASPILFDNMLIVTNDQAGASFAMALRPATGETLWKTERRSEQTAYSTPCIYRPNGGSAELILTGWAHGICGLDPHTGISKWEVDVLDYRVVCSPVIAGGLIFTSCGSGGSGKQMIAVRPPDMAKKTKAEVAYELKGTLPYVPTSVARGDLLFTWTDSGIVTCLDAPTGKIHWRQRVGGNYHGSPVRVADKIYCIDREGQMVVVAAEKQFRLLGKVDLEEPSQSTPAVADGVMYLRTTSHLMAIGGEK